MFASVIIDNPSSNVDYEFEYLVPSIYEAVIVKGARVKVLFGKVNKEVLGYIHEIYEDSKFEGDKKEIIEVLDFEPIISEINLKLADFIQYDTLSPRARVLNQMVPKSMRLKTTKFLQVEDYNLLDGNLAIKFEGKKLIPYTNDLLEYKSIINKMINLGALTTTYGTKVATSEKTVIKYLLDLQKYNEELMFIKNENDLEALRILKSIGKYLTIDDIIENYGISKWRINKFFKMGLLLTKKVVISRIKDKNLNFVNSNFNISPETIKLVDNHFEKLKETNKNVLWIPGSLEEERLFIKKIVTFNASNNKKTLIVVPDILSSYRYSTFITQDTDLNIATLNSKMTSTEEYDYFHFIKKNKYDVIVTTPVAALWSFDDVGAILMIDSENICHRNDQSPRYDLNNVLDYLAQLHTAMFIKHSISPRLIDYSESMLNHYLLLNSKQNDQSNIIVVDMKKDILGINSIISNELLSSLKTTYANNRSSLLILNNKAYSKSIICRSCGNVLRCDECKVSLSYYKDKNMLRCNHCGKKYDIIDKCPKCGNNSLKQVGYGLENVKEILEQELPNVSIIILDNPSINDLNDQYLNRMEDSCIFLTTDVYSRSIIDEKISLIGVINLDATSKAPNYLAHDYAYQLLVHAKHHLCENGKMIIQTYDIDQILLRAVIIDDYNLYFDSEIEIRQLSKVEPFYQVNRIIVKADYQENFLIANKIKKAIWQLIKEEVIILGPSYNYQEKGVQLIIKHRSKKMNDIYHKIYKAYKDTKTLIIFDKYPKYL